MIIFPSLDLFCEKKKTSIKLQVMSPSAEQPIPLILIDSL